MFNSYVRNDQRVHPIYIPLNRFFNPIEIPLDHVTNYLRVNHVNLFSWEEMSPTVAPRREDPGNSTAVSWRKLDPMANGSPIKNEDFVLENAGKWWKKMKNYGKCWKMLENGGTIGVPMKIFTVFFWANIIGFSEEFSFE